MLDDIGVGYLARMAQRLFAPRPLAIPNVRCPNQRAATGRYTVPRPSKLDDATRARLAVDRLAGLSLRELGRRYGVSTEAVRLALQREEAVA